MKKRRKEFEGYKKRSERKMSLGEKLRKAIERLRNAGVIDKETVKEAVKEIQRALISADVELDLVLELSKRIEEEAFREPPKGLTQREYMIKKTYDLLVEFMEGKEKAKKIEEPKRILLIGLFGSGKTSTCAKLAKYYAKRGKKAGLICADTFRPAAFEQLEQLSKKANIPYFGNAKEKNAARAAREGLKKLKDCEPIIVDSAGRSALDNELIKEIKEVHAELKPDLTLLVLGADIGQVAGKQAKAFHEAVGVNGVVITKMDGSAKGGGALIACALTKAPVYFIGVGEKIEDLEEFNAERYLGRIMGYGDLQALLEKAKEVSEEEEFDLEELMQKEFNLETFYQQLKAARKLGPLSKVMEMMGMGMQVPKEQLDIGEQKLGAFKIIMDSMTKAEKLNPDVINRSRIERVSKGSGKKEEEVRELLKHYKQMKNMFKQFRQISDVSELQKKGKMDKLLRKFAGKKKKIKIR